MSIGARTLVELHRVVETRGDECAIVELHERRERLREGLLRTDDDGVMWPLLKFCGCVAAALLLAAWSCGALPL